MRDMTTTPDRLPPNQSLVAPGRWPLVGEKTPADGPDTWTIDVRGEVETARAWTLEELIEDAVAQDEVVAQTLDLHCVTRWSKYDVTFRGMLLVDLFKRVGGVLPAAQFVSFSARSDRGHSTSLTLEDAIALRTMIAWDVDGEPLPTKHGGPVRVVVPGRYFYKSLKWVEGIELRAEDQLGFWEREAGYHNHADPWKEERYMAANVDRHLVRQLLSMRDLSRRDLLGVQATDRDLTELMAVDAMLRDADFTRAKLMRSDFSGANLSNSRFVDADLRRASFRGADLEGADFSGADLRGTDLRGASLFGATFGPEEDHTVRVRQARFDEETRFDGGAFESLTPSQRRWVPA